MGLSMHCQEIVLGLVDMHSAAGQIYKAITQQASSTPTARKWGSVPTFI
jgi:hypothetical protein